jgi:hypothetical protein
LLIFGLIAQAFHPMVLGVTDMAGTGFFLNIMFAIILALLVLLMYDKIKFRPLFWLLFVVACLVSIFMDLFIIAVLIPVLYYAIKDEKRRRTVPGVVAGIFFLVLGGLSALPAVLYLATGWGAAEIYAVVEMTGMSVNMMLATPTFSIGAFMGAILIRNYSGERGKRSKWLFYVAYPVHLAVIAGIMVALGITTFSLFGFITF